MSAAFDTLKQALDNPDPQMRCQALEATLQPDDEAFIPLLVATLSDDGRFELDVGDYYSGAVLQDCYVWQSARSVLVKYYRTQPPEALKQTLLAATSATVRERAALTLGDMGADAVPFLQAALYDRSETVRQAATKALASILGSTTPTANTLDALADRLLDEDPQVVLAAVEALRSPLGQVSVRRRVDRLTVFVTRAGAECDRTRRAACAALGLFKGEEAAALCLAQRLLEDTDSVVLRFAAESLLTVGPCLPPARVAHLIQAVEDRRLSYARPPLIRAIGAYGPAARDAAPACLRLLHDGETRLMHSAPLFIEIRAAAAEALGQLGEAAAVVLPDILIMLQANDTETMETAHLALRHMRGMASDVMTDLLVEVGSTDKSRSLAACKTLEAYGPAAAPALAVLSSLLDRHKPWDQISAAADAIAALHEYGAPAAARMGDLLSTTNRLLLLYALLKLGRHAAGAATALQGVVNDPDAKAESVRLARDILAKIGV